jgi:hypothetical protein
LKFVLNANFKTSLLIGLIVLKWFTLQKLNIYINIISKFMLWNWNLLISILIFLAILWSYFKTRIRLCLWIKFFYFNVLVLFFPVHQISKFLFFLSADLILLKIFVIFFQKTKINIIDFLKIFKIFKNQFLFL